MKHFLLLSLSLFIFSLAVDAQPVDGDKLLSLLGKRQNVTMVSQLNDWIGEGYMERGIRLIFDDSKKLTSIDIYNDKNPYMVEMQKFPGELPLGLLFEHRIVHAKKILGENYTTEGEPSSGLMLIKEFPLDEVDGYEISLDFQVGRLVAVTLKFVESGALSSAETNSIAKTGIRGEDYFTLMKKNAYHLKFKQLNEAIGAPYHTERNKSLYIKQGLGVYFNKDAAIEKMIFYSAGFPCEERPGMLYAEYPIILPYGIKFTDTRQIVIEKCGPPAAEENGALVYKQGLGKLMVFFSGGKVSKLEMVIDKEVEQARKDRLAKEKEKNNKK